MRYEVLRPLRKEMWLSSAVRSQQRRNRFRAHHFPSNRQGDQLRHDWLSMSQWRQADRRWHWLRTGDQGPARYSTTASRGGSVLQSRARSGRNRQRLRWREMHAALRIRPALQAHPRLRSNPSMRQNHNESRDQWVNDARGALQLPKRAVHVVQQRCAELCAGAGAMQ